MDNSGTIGTSSLAHVKAASQQVAVRLINLPDSLQNNRQTLRIEGQIISAGPDKTLLLKTGYGDVTVQARGAIRGQEGQRVQIDVPPGQVPKNSVIRPSSSNETIVPKTETPSLAKTVAEQGVSITRKSDISQSNLTNAQSIAASVKPEIAIKPGILTEGTTVRFVPISGQVIGGASIPQTIATQLQQLQAQFLQGGPTTQQGQLLQIPLSQTLSSFQGLPISNFSGSVAGQAAFLRSVVGFSAPVEGQAQTPSLSQNLSYTLSGAPSSNAYSANSATTLQSHQSFSFPPLSRFDARFITQNTLHSQYPLSGGVQGTPLLLNGQATALTFQVIGFIDGNQAVVSPIYSTHTSGFTPPNPPTFTLQFPANNLQIGSLLRFSPSGSALPQSTGVNVLPVDQFSSLMIAIKELQNTNPAMAQALQALAPAASSTPSRAGAEILFLLSALKGGSLEQWSGQNDASTNRNKLLQMLEQALKEGASPKLVQNTQSGDWRAYSFPMQAQNNVAVPISLYVQDHYQPPQGDDEQEEAVKATRFVFEFDLTRMGEIQVDGMMREKNVDIFIRTRRDLSAEMKKAVRGVYLTALERSDLTGDVAFQSDPKRWLDVSQA